MYQSMYNDASNDSFAQNMFVGSPGVAAMKRYYKDCIDGKHPLQMPLNRNPLTPDGIRIAETNNDGYICEFLKEVFGDKFHGFIAPRMDTLYHVEKGGFMTGEIVIFDPARAGIQQVPLESTGISTTMDTILNLQSVQCCVQYKEASKEASFEASKEKQRGGGKKKVTNDDPNLFVERLQSRDPAAVALQRQAVEAARAWKRRVNIIDYCTPHPRSAVHPW